MKGFLMFVCLFVMSNLSAQTMERYAEIDPVIKDLYAVISGPAGERDWVKFNQLFHETAMMGATQVSEEGESTFVDFTPAQYIERNGAFFEKNGFFEEEIARKTQVFGGVAQVFTAYQYRLKVEGPVAKQGINCIQLAKEKGRWWITNIIWEAASEGNPLPEWAQAKK
jgi:hypothetical protein